MKTSNSSKIPVKSITMKYQREKNIYLFQDLRKGDSIASHKDKMKQTVAKDRSPPLRERISALPLLIRLRFGFGCTERKKNYHEIV